MGSDDIMCNHWSSFKYAHKKATVIMDFF